MYENEIKLIRNLNENEQVEFLFVIDRQKKVPQSITITRKIYNPRVSKWMVCDRLEMDKELLRDFLILLTLCDEIITKLESCRKTTS